MYLDEKKVLLALSGLVLIETTGIGMGFLDVLIRPFTSFIDDMIMDRSNGLVVVFEMIRRVLTKHEELRDLAKHYWPVFDESRKARQWADELERAAVPSALGGKKRERVYPSGDSEIYTSRINQTPPHV